MEKYRQVIRRIGKEAEKLPEGKREFILGYAEGMLMMSDRKQKEMEAKR